MGILIGTNAGISSQASTTSQLQLLSASTSLVLSCAGEIDKLSMEEAGFTNVVSVPEGANRAVSPQPEASKDKAFAYVWNCWTTTEQASCILLATDDDGPGHALAEELARRLGMPASPCWDTTLFAPWALPFNFSERTGAFVIAPKQYSSCSFCCCHYAIATLC